MSRETWNLPGRNLRTAPSQASAAASAWVFVREMTDCRTHKQWNFAGSKVSGWVYTALVQGESEKEIPAKYL
jgi:hypothetical protein